MESFTRTTGLYLISVSLFVLVALSPTASLRAGVVGLKDAHLAVWRLHNDKPIQNPKFAKYEISTVFALSPRHFVGTAHGFRALNVVKGVPIAGLVVTQGRGSDAVILRIDRVLRVSEIHDLALFTTTEKVAHWLKLAPSSELLAQLTAIGYPGGHNQRRMRQVGPPSRDRSVWEFQLPVDVDNLKSASGSPVLDVRGRVVGVFFRAVSNMATALCMENLRAFGWNKEDTRWVSCGNRSFRRCYEAALENVRERARKKDPIAQGRQWLLYTQGVIDSDVDYIVALKAAAEQNVRFAQLLLAFAYHEGDFVVASGSKRDLWYRRAAEQGSPLAQYNLAVSSRHSNPTRSRATLKRLAERGFVIARERLEKMQ